MSPSARPASESPAAPAGPSAAPSSASASAPPSTRDGRDALLARFVAAHAHAYRLAPASLRPASSDASFRRYFRVDGLDGAPSRIVMDAPPDKEDCRPFVQVAQLLAAAGLHAPRVLERELDAGLLLLDDLGSRTYLAALQAAPGDAPRLYAAALAALVRMQQGIDAGKLPPYDAARLRAELALFPTWYIERHLGQRLDAADVARLEQTFDAIVEVNLGEARAFVHRDYHSRNLMLGDDGTPGILDFQDAVCGPLSYDLASLLRDAYIEWPEALQLDWAIRYWEQARAAGLAVPRAFDTFYRQFEWMGLQRHLKVLGIFARLYHRDGKDGYLADLPRVARYARAVAERYRELAWLASLLRRLQGIEARVGYTF